MSKLSPTDAKRLESARSAFLQSRVEAAVRGYESLLKNYPNHCPIVAELSQIYLRFGRLQSAEPLLNRLLQIGKHDLKSLLVAGRGFRQLGKNDKASAALQLALNLKPSPEIAFQIHAQRADLAERTNELEAARVEVGRLLELNPRHFQTQYLAGKISFRENLLDDAEKYLRLALSHTQLAPTERCQVAYDLSKALDRLGRFGESFQILSDAKKIELPNLNQERIKSFWMAELIVRVTNDLRSGGHPVSAKHNSNRMTGFGRPLCFLTGHPRSGTTLVEQMLAAHPSVASADESSALFQSITHPIVFPSMRTSASEAKNTLPKLGLRDLNVDLASESTLQTHLSQYRAQLEWLASNSDPSHYLIDKNPAGLIDLPILESALPATKIVVVLRDPRDVCISCFQQLLGTNPISVNFNTLENTAAKIARDLEFWIAYRRVTLLDWIEIRYEDLIVNPEPELKRLVDFLNLEWDPSVLEFQTKIRNQVIHSPSYSQVIEPLSDRSVGRWKNYRDQFGQAEEILRTLLTSLGYD